LIRIDASDADYAAGLAARGQFHWFYDDITIKPRIEYLRSFSVVPPCEAFASLFSYTVFDYRQKKPLKYSILGCFANFMNNQV
jgi:hypothetical protein